MALQTEGRKADLKGILHRVQWKEPAKLKQNFENWLRKQPPSFEVIIATAAGGGQGALLGGVMGVITKLDPNAASMLTGPANNPQVAALQTAGPWVQARNFAVMTGVNAGLSLAVKKYRGGVEDAKGAMIAAFGSGAAFSMVSGMAGPNPLAGAFSTGVVFALLQGGLFQLGKKFSKDPKKQDTHYARASYMLKILDCSRYERNLKKGLLTDDTIMLWNDSALRDCNIPPGPRLLILHHIDQYRNVLKPGMPVPQYPQPALQ